MNQPTAHVPSDEEKKLYGDFIAETHKREMVGADNFDKSVLTLSSAGLGLSISFLKDFGGQGVVWPCVLYWSWVLFVLATLSTMLSFLFSGKALAHGKKTANLGYLQGDYTAFGKPNTWEIWTVRLNYFSAAAFCFALVLTITFVITNVREKNMATNSDQTGSQVLQKGLTVPVMQRPASAPAPTSLPPTPAAPSSGGIGTGK